MQYDFGVVCRLLYPKSIVAMIWFDQKRDFVARTYDWLDQLIGRDFDLHYESKLFNLLDIYDVLNGLRKTVHYKSQFT